MYSGGDISCKVVRKMPFSGTIFKYSLYKTTIDLKSELPIFAYITEDDKHCVNFIQLNSDKVYPQLVVDPLINITDVDGNERYLYVPVKDSKIVKVYKNDLNGLYALFFIIDSSDIKNQPEDFMFAPI